MMNIPLSDKKEQKNSIPVMCSLIFEGERKFGPKLSKVSNILTHTHDKYNLQTPKPKLTVSFCSAESDCKDTKGKLFEGEPDIESTFSKLSEDLEEVDWSLKTRKDLMCSSSYEEEESISNVTEANYCGSVQDGSEISSIDSGRSSSFDYRIRGEVNWYNSVTFM